MQRIMAFYERLLYDVLEFRICSACGCLPAALHQTTRKEAIAALPTKYMGWAELEQALLFR